MGPRILIAGVGNVFRSDDAFGSEVVRRLPATALPSGARAVDYGIRGVHLAYDLLDGWQGLLLVDAVPDRGRPGTLHVLELTAGDLAEGGLDAHGMDPAAVLATLGSLGGTLPRTLLLGCEVREIGDGMGLSAPVEAAVGEAVAMVGGLVEALRAPAAAAATTSRAAAGALASGR